VWGDSILFCRRAIEPRYGKWTVPAGYLENGETVEAGAKRETYEEAGATVDRLEPYALYNITFINQVYLIFRCRLKNKNFLAGHESLEVRLFKVNEIPWDDIAFRAIRKALKQYVADFSTGRFAFHIDDIEEKIGS
jgi:ADP-ribose pyrophosphatase YjhB (NUDIX family)